METLIHWVWLTYYQLLQQSSLAKLAFFDLLHQVLILLLPPLNQGRRYRQEEHSQVIELAECLTRHLWTLFLLLFRLFRGFGSPTLLAGELQLTMCYLEVLVKLDGISQHQGGDSLELIWGEIFLELLQVALQCLLVDQGELVENRGSLLAVHGGVRGGRR